MIISTPHNHGLYVKSFCSHRHHALLSSRCTGSRGRISRCPPKNRPCSVIAAASVSPGVPTFSWVATGVPLVETMMALTVREAAARSVSMLGFTALAVFIGQKLLDLAENKLAALVERTQTASGVDLVIKTGLVAAHQPIRVILPIYALDYSLLLLGAFTEVAVTKLDAQLHNSFHAWGHWALDSLKMITQLLQDWSEILIVVLLAWFLLAWKTRFLEAFTERLSTGLEEGDEDRWSRILVPLSSLMSWGIVAASISICLRSLGIDISPLLAFGSVTSLVVGFAAQNTIGNVLSAVSLYTSHLFIKGDRIQLKSLSGSVIVAGVVEDIQPLRTVIRTDAKVPVYINNKDVANLLVVNESQLRRVGVRPALQHLDTELVLRYQDMNRVEDIERGITDFLNSCDEVEPGTVTCGLAGFSERGALVKVKAAIRQSLAGKATCVRSKLLRGADKIVRQQGAELAMQPV